MTAPEIFQFAANLGITGILFFMWWTERSDRLKLDSTAKILIDLVNSHHEAISEILKVVRDNTQALTVLTERMQDRTHV